MRSTVTGSTLIRAKHCPPSFALPQANTSSEFSTAGDTVHSFLEAIRNHGYDDALAAAPEEMRETLALINVNRLPLEPEKYAAEAAYAFNVVTGEARYLGAGMKRDYSSVNPDEEIACTLDVVGIFGERGRVSDYKSGWADHGPARDHMQLRFGALCIARAHGLDEVDVSIIRIRDNGEPWEDLATLDALAIDMIAAEVTDIFESLLDAQISFLKSANDGLHPKVHQGTWCKHCPAFENCHAKQGLVRELRSVDADVLRADLNEETAPLLVERFLLMADVLERVEKTLKEWAATHPVTLPSGDVYGPVERKIETIDPVRGAAVIGELYGAKVAEGCVETKTTLTKAQLERALRGWMASNPGNKITKLKAAAEGALRDGDAVKVSVTRPVMVHKPKTEKAEELPAGST